MTNGLTKVLPGDLSELMTFEWMIIDACQNNCSYCSSNTFNQNTLDNMNLYKIGLYKLRTLKRDFKVDLLGGEPTLHHNLEDVVYELNTMEHCKYLDLTTNLKKSAKYFKKFDYKDSKLNIVASFHIEYSKGFLKKCIALKDLEYITFEVNVNLLPDPSTWDETIKLINDLKDNNIKVGYNLLNPTTVYTPVYTKEFFDKFNKDLLDSDSRITAHIIDDNTKMYNELALRENDINYLGMRCSPKHFEIGLLGEITNDCTRKVFKVFDLNTIIEEVRCPIGLCHNQMKYHYEKII